MDERLECANKKQETEFDLLPIMLKSIIIRLMVLGTVSMERRIWRKSNWIISMGIVEVNLFGLEMELQRIYNWIYMEVSYFSIPILY